MKSLPLPSYQKEEDGAKVRWRVAPPAPGRKSPPRQ